MEILRTPDECFRDLEGFAFEPHYVEVEATRPGGPGLRIHYLDEGPRDAAPVLLIHGNPTWSYLHRKFVRPLAEAGQRVIAVDLVGCGRSDKPAQRSDYTQARHVDWLSQWLEALDLREITLYCQDWGGSLGLALVAEYPERFARVVASNTGVPLGEGERGFMKTWVAMMRDAKEFPFDQMIPGGMTHEITPGELAAYKAPFPDSSYQAGICEFPMLIAVQPDNPGVPMNRQVWEALGRFEKPFLTLWGELDPVTPGGDRRLQDHVPGAAGQPHQSFSNASHFIQEDVPEFLVEHLLRFIGDAAPAS
jgi:haloalkane dehalogenase